MRKLVTVFAALVASVALALPASAHTATITCSNVTFQSFSSGPHTASLTVNGVARPVLTWTGSSAVLPISQYTQTAGNPVTVRVAWNTGGESGQASATLTCTQTTTTTTTTTTTRPPDPPTTTVVPSRPAFTG